MSSSSGKKLSLVLGSGTSGDIPGSDWVFDFDKQKGFEATDPFNVIFEFSIEIGVAGSASFDWFSCVVSTNDSVFVTQTKVLFFHRYSFLALKEELNRILQNSEASTWYECTVNLRRYFHWEFDGMYNEETLRKLNS
ncbi:hypothetical protein AU381_22800 [Sinorhizobium glycinis]|uniref:Uncharacterized protein n=2 Tax=Sinorhizobium glycinis TaxID=1472378 RepID=A0A178XUD1_9HYPH|nr:hypothetical protein AU381_22800 [Sinorhizobium glycinis]